jgi:hypothetical protein
LHIRDFFVVLNIASFFRLSGIIVLYKRSSRRLD